MNSTIQIPANGQSVQASLGNFSFFYVRAATNSFQISFDGTTWQNANLNDNFGPLKPSPARVYFRALNGLASNVSFDVGTSPTTPQSTSQRDASTYAKGTYIPAATLPNGTVAVPGAGTKIPSGDNGHQRKQITFTTQADPNGKVIILDANGNQYCVVTPAAPQTFLTDAIFYAVATTTLADLVIGETYYNY